MGKRRLTISKSFFNPKKSTPNVNAFPPQGGDKLTSVVFEHIRNERERSKTNSEERKRSQPGFEPKEIYNKTQVTVF